MKKLHLIAPLALLVAGCSTMSTETYRESPTEDEIAFEAIEDLFEIEYINDEQTEEEAVQALLTTDGFEAMNVQELIEQGVDLTALDTPTVNFAYDSYELSDEMKAIIDAHGELLVELSELKVILEGHTDSRGDRAYNLKLGENRALAVKDALVKGHDIDEKRVEVVSFGKEKLVDSANTEAAHAQNRRAEFRYQ